jgi:alkylhydroperoxidase/carboxymuconolactone decarboxylase family protein YurZ
MFAYDPGVKNESGQILGQGIVSSANTNAQAKVKLANDIGSALTSVAGAYGSMSEANAMGDSAYEALGAIGEMYPGMKSTYGALGKMDPRTRRLASISILDNLGAVSQLGIAGMNQQMRAAQPYVAAGIKNQQNIAGGNVPHGGSVPQSPAGMAPVEPPLPVADENLPAVGGAPMAAPSTSVPGGQASIDAINRDRQRRGLPPIK